MSFLATTTKPSTRSYTSPTETHVAATIAYETEKKHKQKQ